MRNVLRCRIPALAQAAKPLTYTRTPRLKIETISPAAGKRGRRWRRWLGEAALFVLVVAAVGLWQTRAVPSGPAPAFNGPSVAGGTQSLAQFRRDHPGRPIALHFWAEWCPICKTVEGSVDSLRQDHPVLSVALQSGDAAAVARHLAVRGRDWPTVIDETGEITSRYGLQGVPAFVVIDSAGNIRFAEAGYTSEVGMRVRLWWASRFASEQQQASRIATLRPDPPGGGSQVFDR